MKRINYILAGVFLVGIILMGVGAGIAFWEYSSFEYEGEQILGQKNEKKKVLEYKIPKEKRKKKILLRECQEKKCTLLEDNKVPENVIQYEVTYNAEYIDPVIYFTENAPDDEYCGSVFLSENRIKGDFELWMENKDQILNDLKEKKVASYIYEGVTKTKIRVNPKTMKKIKEEK